MTVMLYRLKHILKAIELRQDLGHTANFLWMLNGQEPLSVHIEALDTYLKFTMEHGMKASTFAARVTVSTESDMVAAITSALGTMNGPLHGRAPSDVIDLRKEIQTPRRIESVMGTKLEHCEKIMGFGHRIYLT
ncbi:MAG TPA: citrate/2-methylcitrate synthase [Planococcus sp. (in: firmicutes)]|nr:citrate/2-methylcitrate synthase [Planococcus sp. (in: firmicutes)]